MCDEDEPMEKMEKGSKFVDSEMMKEKEHIGDTVVRLRAEEIFRRVTPGQETVKLLRAGAVSHISKGDTA